MIRRASFLGGLEDRASNVGILISRIGFWGIVYYNSDKETPK